MGGAAFPFPLFLLVCTSLVEGTAAPPQGAEKFNTTQQVEGTPRQRSTWMQHHPEQHFQTGEREKAAPLKKEEGELPLYFNLSGSSFLHFDLVYGRCIISFNFIQSCTRERQHHPKEAEEGNTTQQKEGGKQCNPQWRGRTQHHPKEEEEEDRAAAVSHLFSGQTYAAKRANRNNDKSEMRTRVRDAWRTRRKERPTREREREREQVTRRRARP